MSFSSFYSPTLYSLGRSLDFGEIDLPSQELGFRSTSALAIADDFSFSFVFFFFFLLTLPNYFPYLTRAIFTERPFRLLTDGDSVS